MKGFKPDVVGKEGWFYSEKVKDHFFNPRNIFKTKEEAKKYKADGVGTIGSPVCGDVMKLWIKVDAKKDRIIFSGSKNENEKTTGAMTNMFFSHCFGRSNSK